MNPNVMQAAITIAAIDDSGELTEPEAEAFETIEHHAEYVKLQRRYAEGRIEVRKAMIEELHKANDSDRNGIDRKTTRLDEAMRIAGLDTIKTALVSCFRKTTSAVIVDVKPEDLPLAFVRTKTTTEADKAKIGKYLAAHPDEVIAGVRIETRETLNVR